LVVFIMVQSLVWIIDACSFENTQIVIFCQLGLKMRMRIVLGDFSSK